MSTATAAEIARALDAKPKKYGAWWRCVCPVHGSRDGRSQTLALRDGGDGLFVKCWAGCAPGEIIAELRRRRLIEESAAAAVYWLPPRQGRSPQPDLARRIAAARRIWDQARPASGTPVAAYLASRGLTIDPPPSLRWAPRCWHTETRTELPAMLARVEHAERGFVGISRTYLSPDGAGIWRRRNRAFLGPIAGGAVRLAESPPGGRLVIGEGIETTLSVMVATGLSGWAALSTGGLVGLALPADVRDVVIFADRDKNGAGQLAAERAASRWIVEGRRVRIALPPGLGEDANDMLLRGG